MDNSIKLEPPVEYFDGQPTIVYPQFAEILENINQMSPDCEKGPNFHDNDTDITVTTEFLQGFSYTSSLRTVIKLILPPNSITSDDHSMENGRNRKVFLNHVKAGGNIYTIKVLLSCSRDPDHQYQEDLARTEHMRPRDKPSEKPTSKRQNMHGIFPQTWATDAFHSAKLPPEKGLETTLLHNSNSDGSPFIASRAGIFNLEDSDSNDEPSFCNVEVPQILVNENHDSDDSSDHFLELLHDMTTEELEAYDKEASSTVNIDEIDTFSVRQSNTGRDETSQGYRRQWDAIFSDPVVPRVEIVGKCVKSLADKQKSAKTKIERNAKKRFKIDNSFYCLFCAKEFSSKQNLIQHNKIHNSKDGFRCRHCGKKFATQNQMKIHEMTHIIKKNHECCICGRVFCKLKSLQWHMRGHRKKYNCLRCQKRFFHKSNLLNHFSEHAAEKTFQCEECGRFFSQRNGLNQHMKVHIKSKLFKCEICSKTYRRQNRLESHIENAHTKESEWQEREIITH